MNFNRCISYHPYLAFVIFLFCSCEKKITTDSPRTEKTTPSSEVSVTEVQAKSIGLELGKIEWRKLNGAVSVSGVLDVPPQNMVNITAPFGGFLRSTSLLQGMKISKGQIIATIENPEYIQIQQEFLDSKSQVEFLEKESDRQQELAKENVNSQKILQRSMADLTSMKAKYNGLRLKLKMLGVNSETLTAESMRSVVELHSPINGYVTHVNSAVGSFVNPVDVLFQIVDTKHLHAELTAFERDIPKIKIGQKIRFTLSNESTERIAEVYLIGREINEDRTVRIHGHIEEEDKELIPGMYLKAVIETGGLDAQSVPEDAVVNYEDKNFIFVEESANHFRLVEVNVGIHENGFVEILLSSTENSKDIIVVTKGAYKLLSKMKNNEDPPS